MMNGRDLVHECLAEDQLHRVESPPDVQLFLSDQFQSAQLALLSRDVLPPLDGDDIDQRQTLLAPDCHAQTTGTTNNLFYLHNNDEAYQMNPVVSCPVQHSASPPVIVQSPAHDDNSACGVPRRPQRRTRGPRNVNQSAAPAPIPAIQQRDVCTEEGFEESLKLIDYHLQNARFRNLLQARAKCIRDIQCLHVGFGADSGGEAENQEKKPKRKRPEETSLEPRNTKALTAKLQKSIKWQLDNLDQAISKMAKELKGLNIPRENVHMMLNRLRELSLIVTRQPGPVLEHKKTSPAIGNVDIRLLGGVSLWEELWKDGAELYFLSEGSAQEILYGKSDTGFRDNNLFVNHAQKDGKLGFQRSNRLESYKCLKVGVEAAQYSDPTELTWPNSTALLTRLEATFRIEVRRYDKDTVNVSKNEEATLFGVPLRHYYCVCQVGGFQTMSLPFLVGSHSMKQVVKSMGGRLLAETIIFCGTPDINGRIHLPPEPARKEAWVKGWDEKVATEILNARRSDERRCEIKELVGFLEHAFLATTDTKRPLNKHCLHYLEGRLMETAKTHPHHPPNLISWAQFSRRAVPKRKDIPMWFSLGTWLWGNMELLREDKPLKALYEAGLLILFAKSEKIMGTLRGRPCSMSMKAAETRPPGHLTLSYNSELKKDHATVTLENLTGTVRGLGKVKHLKGLHETLWICGWAKEDPEKFAFYPKSEFEKVSSSLDCADIIDNSSCKSRKLVEQAERSGLYCSTYTHDLMSLVLPSAVADLRLSDRSDSDSGCPPSIKSHSSLPDNSPEHLMVLLEESISGLENAVNSGERVDYAQDRLHVLFHRFQSLLKSQGSSPLTNSGTHNLSSDFDSDTQDGSFSHGFSMSPMMTAESGNLMLNYNQEAMQGRFPQFINEPTPASSTSTFDFTQLI